MLTEVGHGLDARNLETTATLLPSGCFDLHSPSESAWKAMPPSTPLCGMPRVAIVFARLIVGHDDRGVKPFVVELNDSQQMCRGITSRALPVRPGTKPLDHAVTSFDHVLLPPTALLGSEAKPDDNRRDFLRQIWRVSIGTLSLSIMGVSALRIGSRIALTYSRRRLITTGDGQQGCPFYALVLRGGPLFEGFKTLSGSVRQALAVVFKTSVGRETKLLTELSERCGWQGLFDYNQISELALTFQGNSIAEGDTLVLCIRLGSELLGDKYSLPEPQDPLAPLAKHELGLIAEARQEMIDLGGYAERRSAAFNNNIVPRCRRLIEAIGERMAYEAARVRGVQRELLHLYELLCIEEDLSWYTGSGVITRNQFFKSLVEAYKAVLPLLLQFANNTEEAAYITAPIMSDESWSIFLQTLPSFGHNQPSSSLETSSKL
ncbi:Acyl-CoA oxidase/dehydrogenase, central domain protein [Metarhizium guizhouense ARSEF 977]|uniref:Acyl-CoA oxidase/dehydrogenase, central domain protein n=1 Tax=Metarhizium guizhouense (strain ARSEF 977) TaxID=1276136 RepID=A0A0B4HR94_METGA|nr:Acyl-CoA oxidase/dehydrogenase, central domain protein [Metarhizium guizhouense ARSEF 977]